MLKINKRITIFSMTLLILILQIMFQIFIPLKVLAATTVTIQYKDEAFYEDMLVTLDEISSNDNNLTITTTQDDIDGVDSIVAIQSDIKDITGIEHFTNLDTLILYENQITDISALRNLKKLTSLHLHNNNITDISALSGLTNLTGLSLNNNKIEDISALSNMSNLKQLTLHANNISNIEPLNNLEKLENLSLNNNKIEDISALKNLTNLTILLIENNYIKDISPLDSLTKLDRVTMNSQTINIQSNTYDKIQLPKIFAQAKQSGGIAYTSEDFTLSNCTVNSSYTEINATAETASIKINGGLLAGSILNVKVVEETTDEDDNKDPEDTTPPVLSIEYSNTNMTSEDVIVTITADEEIQEVDGWTISNDKKSLSKTYTENVQENIEVQDLYGNVSQISVSISNIDKQAPDLSIEYSNTNMTNENIVATITANEEIQEVEGWTISNDKKSLSKTYTENVQENVDVQDLYGNTSQISVSISNIDKQSPILEVSYSEETLTNGNVTVTIISNEKVQNVSDWTLSEDMLTLSKTYTENTQEQIVVYDLAGNSSIANISVTNIDKETPSLEVLYSTKEITNENVTVTITSNKQLQEVEGWTRSEDMLTLSKIYTQNTEETVTIYDLAGNSYIANISINNIDKESPILEVNITPTETTSGSVTVEIRANESIQPVEGWTLSEDQMTLSKTYIENAEERLTIYDLAGNSTTQDISVNNIDNQSPQLEVNYSTSSLTNSDVIVTITSNKPVQAVDGWALSESQMELSKTYEVNTEENIIIYDLVGNSTEVSISISNIDKVSPEYDITYSTLELTNENIVVTITANELIQGMEGWTLSENQMTLSKIYEENIEENIMIYDLAGNSTIVDISIENIDKIIPQIEMTYSITEPTNENVTVTIMADEQIQSIEGWTLSEDQMTLSKTYTQNTEENVIIYDLAGNSINANVLISNIDKEAPELEVTYNTEKENIIVTITANEQIQGVEGWTLSEDQMTLSKIYTQNIEERLNVYDLVGNNSVVEIKVDQIQLNDNIGNNNLENNNISDTTKSPISLPATGGVSLIFVILAVIIIGIIQYKKYRYLKNIK